jgi:hypothetical protein
VGVVSRRIRVAAVLESDHPLVEMAGGSTEARKVLALLFEALLDGLAGDESARAPALATARRALSNARSSYTAAAASLGFGPEDAAEVARQRTQVGLLHRVERALRPRTDPPEEGAPSDGGHVQPGLATPDDQP